MDSIQHKSKSYVSQKTMNVKEIYLHKKTLQGSCNCHYGVLRMIKERKINKTEQNENTEHRFCLLIYIVMLLRDSGSTLLFTLQWLALAEIHCLQRRSLLTDSNDIKILF